LHNNHHAFPTSAKFSMRPHEFDLGWAYLTVLSKLKLAKIRRVATPPALLDEGTSPVATDIDALRAVIVNRMYVLRHYTQNVTVPVRRRVLESLGDNANAVVAKARAWLSWQPHMLDEQSREHLDELRKQHPRFETVMQFR